MVTCARNATRAVGADSTYPSTPDICPANSTSGRARSCSVGVNSAGVQTDGILTEGAPDNYNWDGLWNARTSVDADGWATFVLDRRGRLVSHWLEESTGSEPLDVESLAIVERAQPFPIPPSELDETHLRMSAPFVFAARPAHHLRDSPDIGKIREIFEGEAQVDTKMRSICRGC